MNIMEYISKEEAEYAEMILAAYKEQQKKFGDELPPDIKKIGFFVCRKVVKKDGEIEKNWATRNLQLCEVIGLFEIIKFELITALQKAKE